MALLEVTKMRTALWCLLVLLCVGSSTVHADSIVTGHNCYGNDDHQFNFFSPLENGAYNYNENFWEYYYCPLVRTALTQSRPKSVTVLGVGAGTGSNALQCTFRNMYESAGGIYWTSADFDPITTGYVKESLDFIQGTSTAFRWWYVKCKVCAKTATGACGINAIKLAEF